MQALNSAECSCTQAAPYGGEWAASALPPLHQLLSAHRPQVTSALAAAFDDAVQLLPDEVGRQWISRL
jgi:hypothetical protein